jgi:hypothetical protein
VDESRSLTEARQELNCVEVVIFVVSSLFDTVRILNLQEVARFLSEGDLIALLELGPERMVLCGKDDVRVPFLQSVQINVFAFYHLPWLVHSKSFLNFCMELKCVLESSLFSL